MDVFQCTTAAFALVELCIRITRFIRTAQQTATAIEGDLSTLEHEVQSLQTISRSIAELRRTFQQLGSDLSIEHERLLQGLVNGCMSVIEECQGCVGRVEPVVQDILGPVADGVAGIRLRDAANLVRRRNKKKPELDRLRQNISSSQSRLQTFYTALNFFQGLATAASLRDLTDDLRRSGFQIRQQLSQSRTGNDHRAAPAFFQPLTQLLGAAKLNKYFDIPRSVGSFFVGRRRLLDQLKCAFDEQHETASTSAKIFVIQGFPGSGKTDFSFKFAEQFRENFWGVFTIQADTDQLVESSFKQIMRIADRNAEPTLAGAKQWLANQDLPWLLIFDNADNPELQMERYFPSSTSGCILVTTRNHDFRIHGNVGKKFFTFERLPRDEAKTVLLKAAGEPSPTRRKVDDAAGTISDELQCLPLALVSAGKMIRSHYATWINYLDWYRRSWERVSQQLGSGKGLQDFKMEDSAVISTIETNLKKLEELQTQSANDALELIHTLGYFHHRNITFDLLRLVAKNAKVDIVMPKDDSNTKTRPPSPKPTRERVKERVIGLISGPPMLPAVLKNINETSLDEDRLRAALSTLEYSNLIRRDDLITGDEPDELLLDSGTARKTDNVFLGRRDSSTENFDTIFSTQSRRRSTDLVVGDGRYSLHPLVQQWVRYRPASLARKAAWCEAAHTALSQSLVIDVQAFSKSSSPYFDAREVLPHMSNAIKAKEDLAQQLVKKRSEMGWIRRSIGFLYPVPPTPCWLTQFQEVKRTINYSLVYTICGDYQNAAALQQEARAFVVSGRGMNDPISINLTRALVQTLHHLSQTDEALTLLDEAVEACRKIYGPDHPKALDTISQRGEFITWHGHARKGNDILEAYEGFRQLGPQYRVKTLITQRKLASGRIRTLELREAKRLLEEVVQGLSESDSEDDEIILAKIDLAMALGELHEGSRAYEIMQDVYQQRVETLGPNHPLSLWAVVNLVRAMWRIGEYDKGLEMLVRPREVAVNTWGEKHLGVLTGDIIRGCLLRDGGRYADAEKMFLSVVARFVEKSRENGTIHPDGIVAMGRQVELYDMLGRYKEALDHARTMYGAMAKRNPHPSVWNHPLRWRTERKIVELEVRVKAGQTDPKDTTMLSTEAQHRIDQDGLGGQQLMDFSQLP